MRHVCEAVEELYTVKLNGQTDRVLGTYACPKDGGSYQVGVR